MGWFKDRIETVAEAKRRKAAFCAILTVLAVALVGQLWPEIKPLIEPWVTFPSAKGEAVTILGIPILAWGISLAGIIFGLWMLEHAHDLRKELSPNLTVTFEPEKGGVTETTGTDRDGKPVADYKYVRLTVVSSSRKSVGSCVANLVKIERRLDLERTETVWDDDALPLVWAVTHETETKVHYLTKRFVDVCRIQKPDGIPQLLSIIPNRLAPELKKKGHFILTIVVTGDGLSETGQIEIEIDGTYKGFKARAI